MAQTINADDGVISGSAGLKSSSDGTAILSLQTKGTTALTVDGSQNVGIGTSSPAVKLAVVSTGGETFSISGGGTSAQYQRFNTTGGNYYIGVSSSTGTGLLSGASNYSMCLVTESARDMIFGTNNTERARITSAGFFGIGTTNPGLRLTVSETAAANTANFINDSWDWYCIQVHNTDTVNDNLLMQFVTDAGSGRGSITYNRTGGLIAYNTTSDYRAKDIIGPVENSGETIDALQVYMGQMHGATVARPMLIAHEAQAVTPYAVTGEKDAEKEDGTPIYQQMDHSTYVPLLIAEIQSLRARVAALEAK